MRTTAKKFTYDKPMFVSSPNQDYSIQPEIYRRYINRIIGYYIFFICIFSLILNLILNKTLDVLFDKGYSLIENIKLFFGHFDDENKILYGLFLLFFFSVVIYPTKKITYILTKPENRINIEEGLCLIKGLNVLDELEKAFEEMNDQ